jgi:hypothetical protein
MPPLQFSLGPLMAHYQVFERAGEFVVRFYS